MYPRIPWELAADPLRSAKHTLGTTALDNAVTLLMYIGITQCITVHGN